MLTSLRNGSLVTPASATPINRMNSLIERFFDDEFVAPLNHRTGWSNMPLSLWQDENNAYVELDTPGVTENDLEIQFEDGTLVIRVERKCQWTGTRYDTRNYGRIEQRVSLPAHIDSTRIEARLQNGVLTLTCPKSEEAKPRKITVKAG